MVAFSYLTVKDHPVYINCMQRKPKYCELHFPKVHARKNIFGDQLTRGAVPH